MNVARGLPKVSLGYCCDLVTLYLEKQKSRVCTENTPPLCTKNTPLVHRKPRAKDYYHNNRILKNVWSCILQTLDRKEVEIPINTEINLAESSSRK